MTSTEQNVSMELTGTALDIEELIPEEVPVTAVGVLLLLLGLFRQGTLGALLAFAGGVLTYRGIVAGEKIPTGRASIRQDLGVDGGPAPSEEPVEEASWESFPASDAPAWTGGHT